MPPRLREVACRDCGAMVSWVLIAATQKRWPINPTANDREGRVFFANNGWHVTSRNVAAPVATSLYVTHWTTCAAKKVGRR